jgi:hypothetical protein
MREQAQVDLRDGCLNLAPARPGPSTTTSTGVNTSTSVGSGFSCKSHFKFKAMYASVTGSLSIIAR